MSYVQCMLNELIPFLTSRGFERSPLNDPGWEQWRRTFENAGLFIVVDQHERDDRVFLNIEDQDSVTLFYNGPREQYESTICMLIAICELAEQRAAGFVRYQEPVGGMLFGKSFDEMNAVPQGAPLTFIDEAVEISEADMQFISNRPLPRLDVIEPDSQLPGNRCFWCNTDPEEAAARHEGPHATWCPHYRRPAMPAMVLPTMLAGTVGDIAAVLRKVAHEVEAECVCGHSQLEHEDAKGKCHGSSKCSCPGFLQTMTEAELPAAITQATSRMQRSDALADAAQICECGHLKLYHRKECGCVYVMKENEFEEHCKCIKFTERS